MMLGLHRPAGMARVMVEVAGGIKRQGGYAFRVPNA